MADETLTPTDTEHGAPTPTPTTTHLLVVPHTHWDREWYQTFQQFRMRLVRAVDAVLETLEADPAFTYFTLDGQTIVLDDYLEVRPGNAPRLRRLAREGRLLVGPWYLQPDEYLVGGESLIRNLQLGRRGAAEYGGPMPVGYVPDTFGHIAQLPQILRGFELDNAVFWRGVGPEIERNVFRWAAPDGSEVLALWLHDQYGYSNAAVLPFDPDALVARLDGTAARMRPKALANTLLLMNGSDHQEPQPGLPEALAAAAPLLAAHGLDAAIGTLPQYVTLMRQTSEPLERHRGELRSGHYAHLLPGVLSTRMWLKQANAAGEALLLRWAEPATALAAFASGMSAPHPTALLDLAWKHLLHCHPHDSICGCGIDQVHAEMLPRFAQSAQIAEELTARALDQLAAQADTRGPARAVPLVVFNPTDGPRSDTVRAQAQIRFARYEVRDDEGHVVPFQVTGSEGQVLLDERVDPALVAAMMGMLVEGRALGYAVLDAAITPVVDRAGEVEVAIVASQTAEPDLDLVERLRQRILVLAGSGEVTAFHIVAREAPRTDLLLLARDVPSHGARVFFVRPLGDADASSNAGAGAQASAESGTDLLAVEPLAIENAHLRVEVDTANGTLSLRDKRTGYVYAGLNQLADSGDVGDLYNWSPPAHDTVVSVPLWPPDVTIIASGPARATLRIRRVYALPATATPDRQARSGVHVTCETVSEVSLTPGARRVEVRTTVENTARDHRLRAVFPLPFAADHADAEGVFEVARRPAQLAGSEPGAWSPQVSAEQPVNTFPQKRFVDLSDGGAGLAILNRGLPEYEVLAPDGERTGSAVALTLLRCVEWLSRDDLATRRGHAGPPLRTPEAQGLGTRSFEYALVPHAGTWADEGALVPREAVAFETDLRAVTTSQHAGPLGSHWSAVYVTPAAVQVSAIKRAADGDGLVVRLHNPLAEPVEAEVILNRPFAAVEVLNLAEDRVRAEETASLARILSTGVRSRLRGGEIQTLRFRGDRANQ